MVNRPASRARALAAVLAGERAVASVVRDGLADYLTGVRQSLSGNGWDVSAVATTQQHAWAKIVDERVIPALASVYQGAYDRGTGAVTAAAQPTEGLGAFISEDGRSLSDLEASRYLTSTVRNRLAGVSDTVFQQITHSLEEGRQRTYDPVRDDEGNVLAERIGEGIPEYAARVDALLDDTQRWAGRATTIARTEVIAANNAGSHAAAGYNADVLGVGADAVAKEWLATSDSRTRESHAEADGQMVVGLATPFDVGGSSLDVPGDPSGPPEEVVNCRCTALYHYPGDADYPADAAATLTEAPAPSLFDSEALGNTLDPSRRSSASTIQKELAATPAGQHLSAVIKGFTETRGGVATLRSNIEKALGGSASKVVQERTDAFLDALNSFPTSKVPDLFRGMAVKVTDTNTWWDAFEAQFQPGQHLSLNASSFTSSEKKAAEFSGMIGGTRRATSNYTAVRFVLEGGSHALPVESLSKFKSEKEWISGGEYEVVGYSAATPQQPYYRVTLRQVKSLGGK